MILISHRGNLTGPNPERENSQLYIQEALDKEFDVEIDVWVIDDIIYMGHDKPQYGVDFRWFRDRVSKLWIHCKNVQAIVFFQQCGYEFNYFWHQEDDVTLTSKNHIWAYPGKQPIKNSIAVMPEINNDSIVSCKGVCSDYIEKYK